MQDKSSLKNAHSTDNRASNTSYKLNFIRSFIVENKIEFLLFILFWLISIAITFKIFNRPLGGNNEFLTGTTLTGLRAFETHGLWPLAGQLNRLPYSFEFYGIEPKELPGWKPNHPSLFLVAPYFLYKILNFMGLTREITPAFIQTYQLVFTRLISIILVYFIVKNILKNFEINNHARNLISLVSTFFWLFNPPVLYWTQNVYHEDQAHLTPSLMLILLTIHYGFNFLTSKKCEMAIQFLIALWVSSSSYYGWLLIPSISLFSILKTLDRNISINRVIRVFREQLLSQKFLYMGMGTSILIYFYQLYYLGADYLNRPFERFLARTSTIESEGKIHNNVQIIRQILEHISYYLPLSNSETKNIIFSIFSIISILVLYYVMRKGFTDRKKDLLITLGFVTITPISYVFLLKNYSYLHEFSVLKIALPLLLFSIALPLALLENKFNFIAKYIDRSTFSTFFVGIISLIFLSQITYPNLIHFAGPTHTYSQDLGALVVNNIARDELPTSENLFVSISPPYTQYYTSRLIYKLIQPDNQDNLSKYSTTSVNELVRWGYNGSANLDNIQSMKLVYLEYSDNIGSTPVEKACNGYWSELKENVEGRSVSICRSPTLKNFIPLTPNH